MKVRNQKETEKVELQMTPMIDIVFQLLVFFIMTFKIVTPEGDFNIKMPLAAPSESSMELDDIFPPLKVRLTADGEGELASIRLGDQSISNFDTLQREVLKIVGTDIGPNKASDFEVELDCDYNLKYEYVIDALTAVTGSRDPESGQITKYIEKVKFAPPRKEDS
ncbi:Biopolymer transporter ExbD [Planctomycetales bacterium 10988]|nr:Biopolymer transporter ExbD [Planctomycetales bacterium 10988]